MATTLISVAEYLATSYRPDREYIDGRIEERHLGEYDHANLQGALIFWFRQRQHEWNIRVLPEQRVQVSPTHFRVPDVTIIDRTESVEQILAKPPLAVIEVLSPEDTWPRTEERIADYLAFGIAYIWILEPSTQQAWAVSAEEGRRQKVEVLEIPNSPITVSLEDLFRELD
jgi:Uma2 family endonuclease